MQQQTENTYEKFASKESGLGYLLAILLPQLIGGFMVVALGKIFGSTESTGYLFSALVVTQMLIFVGTFASLKFNFKKTMPRIHANKPAGKWDMLLMLPLSIALIFGLNFLPTVFLEFLKLFGYKMAEMPFPQTDTIGSFLLGIVCICAIPAVVEEILFRGLILRTFSRKKAWVGIIFSALLFTLLHGNAQQTIYQFAIGVILGVVAIKTNSIYPCMLLHFLNNFISIAFSLVEQGKLETVLYYALIPSLVLAFILVFYLSRRKTPNFCEREADWQYRSGSVQLKSEDGNIYGMSRDITGFEEIIRKSDARQGKIFYGIAIVFGLIIWVLMASMGY